MQECLKWAFPMSIVGMHVCLFLEDIFRVRPFCVSISPCIYLNGHFLCFKRIPFYQIKKKGNNTYTNLMAQVTCQKVHHVDMYH